MWVPVRSSWTAMSSTVLSYRASNNSIVAEPISPKT